MSRKGSNPLPVGLIRQNPPPNPPPVSSQQTLTFGNTGLFVTGSPEAIVHVVKMQEMIKMMATLLEQVRLEAFK